MAPGPNESPILSSSPLSIRPSHSPVRHRTNSTHDPDADGDGLPRSMSSRHSPNLTRSHLNPLDPDVRERQRTMDADMAMQLSRVRSATISQRVPPMVGQGRSDELTPTYNRYSHPPGPDFPFPEPEMSVNEDQLDYSEATRRDSGENHSRIDLLSAPAHLGPEEHDHPHMVQQTPGHHDLDMGSTGLGLVPSMGELPMYRPMSIQHTRPKWDFSGMEDFAKSEKIRLGIHIPQPSVPIPTTPAQTSQEGEDGVPTADATISTSTGFMLPPRRPRERKLSSSNAVNTRRGKMVLFEQAMNNSSGKPLSTHIGVPGIPEGTVPSSSGGAPAHMGGHDRPYRFSFYSNALSQTIHSRSLSELPTEGQSFEELFAGVLPPELRSAPQSSSTSPGTNGDGTSKGVPTDFALRMELEDQMKKENGDADSEQATWWLDVMSPTDEEMKMLSQVFGIHPLTTEDIQMEEAREKIELFRNYYFVCFRGFDQDPYSPTHLDPINMYVIVFREGTLSFHFRPTPHPQNVRRRIKQLKDYINVTSDWISYALIDDITDAFGPLIQGIEYEVDSIDELVLILKDAEQGDMLRRIGTCRKKVMGLLRLMGNKADVVKGLAKRCNENWRVAPTSDIGLYLSDIQDHLITMTQNLNHYEKILSRSHSNYLAQISIEMTDANNQINDVLSKLTALGTILIPMNLVTGLWGMNVHVPGQDVPGYAWFAGILACLAAIAVVGSWSTYKLMTR